MSLFSNLLNLHAQPRPVEDFFTEIVAYFFEDNKPILLKWLRSNDRIILGDDYSEIHVSTQKNYEPLDGHNYGSRPDILIELSDGTEKDVIFIESKIGSDEGDDQLKRYADILAAQQKVRHRNLIFITRDYEPKNEHKILDEKSSGLVNFIQLRWHEFYRFLQQHEKEKFVPEIMDFMRTNNMARNNQFSSIDLLAMTNFRKSLNVMEATLGDEVKDQFCKLVGTAKKTSVSLTQFRENGRYIILCHFHGWNFWCGLGYFDMNADSLTDYPNIGIVLEVSPKNSEQRHKIIDAMDEIVNEKRDIWAPYKLQDSTAWANISYLKSLQKFLAEKDHVLAIKKFFLSAIKEVEIFKNKYPDLPWSGSNIEESEE